MVVAAISYSSLKKSAGEARDVARKLNRYSDSVSRSIYRKLNNYDGDWSSNVDYASRCINSKIESLDESAEKYKAYAENIEELKSECSRTDKSVKSKISSLTAEFKRNNNIRNNAIENALSFIITKIDNKNPVRRWIKDKFDKFESKVDYVRQQIKDWYNYEGGKEYIKGKIVSALEIAIGVLTVIGAVASIIATGGASLVLIATIIGGVISTANGIADAYNEDRAYNASNKENDPAKARNLSKMDTLSGTLRHDSDEKGVHLFAFGLDATSLACTVITLGSDVKKLFQNGYKWVTGFDGSRNSVSFKDIFSRNTLNGIQTKFNGGMENLKEVGLSLRRRDTGLLKQMSINYGKEFMKGFASNFKDNFINYKDISKGISSTKNILGLSKDYIKGDFNFKNLVSTSFEKIALPCITVVNVPGVTILDRNHNVIADFSDVITIDSFTSIIDDMNEKVFGSPIFKNSPIIDPKVMDRIKELSNIRIPIPTANYA